MKIYTKYDKPGEWEVVIPFDKPNVDIEWVGVIDARSPGIYKLKVIADHSAVRTRGRVTIKAVVDRDSKVEIKGIIQIRKDAQETDNFLEIRVLTLDSKAYVVAEPELMIEANNVKASHGASIGMIDPEQMLYLKSKGISSDVAINTIVEGFVGV